MRIRYAHDGGGGQEKDKRLLPLSATSQQDSGAPAGVSPIAFFSFRATSVVAKRLPSRNGSWAVSAAATTSPAWADGIAADIEAAQRGIGRHLDLAAGHRGMEILALDLQVALQVDEKHAAARAA
jgi:hypothetical protein